MSNKELSDADVGVGPVAQQPTGSKSGEMSDADIGVPTDDMSWGKVATEAAKNFLPSAQQLGSDIVQPFVHPIDTAQAIGNLGMGAYEKVAGGGPHEKHFDALMQHYADRYGGMENFKSTIAKDPVGFLADLSTVLSGGAAAPARIPGVVGQGARVVGRVGSAIDPIMAPVNAVKATGAVLPKVLGATTGAGTQAMETAYQSGVKGGTAGEAFRDNLRGYANAAEVVDDARAALQNMKQERSAQYLREMAPISKDQTVLDFTMIDKALADANKVRKFGTQTLDPSASKVRQAITDIIDEWRGLDPAMYHTPAGLDALKQKIGDLRSSIPYTEGASRKVANEIYSGIWNTIKKQAPDYAGVMKNYERASNQIDEISKGLSLDKRASVDTALRKLQSALRNNVQTNWGHRTEMVKQLASKAGAPELMEKLSGQGLSSWTPRGLMGVVGVGQGLHAINSMSPVAAATLPLTSPRLMGEVVHGIGRAAGKVPESVKALPTPFRVGAQSSRLIGQLPDEQRERARGGRIPPNARRAPDGKYYIPDKSRPGKYLRVDE